MTLTSNTWDAIVVGAGPAGAAAAIHLARRKRRVLLLDRCVFPRDKSCGDGLTQSAVSLLDEIGVLPDLPPAPKIRGARIYLKGRGYRDFSYPDCDNSARLGLVVRRFDLDASMCRRAVLEGSELWQGADVRQLLYQNGRVVGVEASVESEAKRLYAHAVVAADGSSSRLASQAGLTSAPAEMGFAVRGYYSGVQGLTDYLEIYIPLLDPTDRYLLPSYGWVFPTGANSANIGVGVFQRVRGANVRRLMECFLASLMRQSPRFENLRPCGPWRGAPLRFDFIPERCMADGLLLAGDAAGLISPFTGEGISYALSSGKLAAEVIDEGLLEHTREPLDLSAYAKRLATDHAGYFEAGRHSARRYSLIWHLIESTFHNDRPLFALCRRAALFPEGIAEAIDLATLEDVSPLAYAPVFRLKSDLQAVHALVLDTVRREWPILAQLKQPGEQELGILFRPAMLLLLSYYCGHGRDENALWSATAVELGYLSAIAHYSVHDGDFAQSAAQKDGKKANWGNLLALGLGDFLLSKALALGARVGPHITTAMTEALAGAAEARVRERQNAYSFDISVNKQLETIEDKSCTFFELPCRLGGLCGALTEPEVAALACYGRKLAVAHHLVDDLLAITGADGPLGGTARLDVAEGVYSLPISCAARKQSDSAMALRKVLAARPLTPEQVGEAFRLVRESDAVDEVFAIALKAKSRAQDALCELRNSEIRRTLSGLADSAVRRIKR
jgi:geranylgeranyl reductase family protein